MFCHSFKTPACGSQLADNFISKLCHRWTTSFLITFSFVITCRLLLGDSFECLPHASFSGKYLNTRCYADGAYTILSHLVIQESPGESAQNYRRYNSHYQWVNLLFLVHAFNFYLPHLLLKVCENGLVRRLTEAGQSSKDLGYIAQYVLTTRGKHRLYLSINIILEACNFAISLGQTLWLIKFFDVTGVPKFLPFELKTWSDFRQMYFPPSGICEVMKPGVSGAMTRYSVMCELPLNQLFMYMFLFLHAWYLFITILTGLVLVYRIVLMVPVVRGYASKLSAPLAERAILKSLCYHLPYSDWFFLTRLQKTMIDVDFAELVGKIDDIVTGRDLQKEMDDKSSLFEEKLKDLENSSATTPI